MLVRDIRVLILLEKSLKMVKIRTVPMTLLVQYFFLQNYLIHLDKMDISDPEQCTYICLQIQIENQ